MDAVPQVPAASRPVMPLTAASVGEQLVLAEICGGHGLRLRLAEMGLVPGTRFRIVSRGNLGPCIIDLRGSRLVLGRGVLDRVLVRPA